ncbi:hypothetical protein [Kosakonia sacchari]|uniref:Glycosyltransferase RgtA/B/C/D-like domain-containing protein n=1 Tax=Kosakonia sacchari TaxID=1158459 RepID=A0ABZ0MVB6_9ENTR|nr:hypothetical protein [Kosakonia sacchari]WOZ79007.1 hypothetical protein Q8Y70_08130 [Kosakonia sacchari]
MLDMNKINLNSFLSTASIGMLVFFIWYCFAPGFMSFDSIVQYESAYSGVFADNHPAIMSFIWHYLMKLIPGPQSLLCFHLLLLAVGLFAWQKNISHPVGVFFLVVFFLSPWIINFSGVLWKDVGMAFSLLTGTALLFNNRREKSIAIWAFPFLFYALAVRYNSIVAILPLVFLALRYHFPAKKIWFSIFLSIFIVAFSYGLSKFITYNVIHAEKRYYETLLMGDDIAEIAAKTDQNLLPAIKNEDLKACSIFPILYERALCFIEKGYDPSGSLVVNMQPTEVYSLWKRTVLENPLLYIENRLTAFAYFLRSPSLEPVYSWFPGVMDNNLGITLYHKNWADSLGNYVLTAQKTTVSGFFKPYVWLISAIVMLAAALLVTDNAFRTQIISLNSSSLGCFLSLLLAVPSVDFRYIYWCVIATTVSFVIFITATIRKELYFYRSEKKTA